MLRAILVDDEESNLSSLREKLKQHCPEVEIIASCDSAAEGMAEINRQRPDLVFLDIEMPVMNGFVMLQQLEYRNFELVFTTAYDHYAIKAIRFSALDYLVKPIEIEELKSAVQRAAEKRNHSMANPQIELLVEQLINKNSNPVRIAIPTTDGLKFVKTDEIIYLEAHVNYSYIYTSSKQKHIVSRTLKEFEDLLPASTFIRIHHSYIINKNFTDKYIRGEGGQVVLTNGVVLDVAKRKKAEFLKAIGQ